MTRSPLPFDPRPTALGALPMALALALPWVLFRANRLVDGEALRPDALALLGLGLLLAALLFAAARRHAPAAALLAGGALLAGPALFAFEANGALAGASDIARASASSGLWLWLLGSGVALYGAALALPPKLRLLSLWWLLPLAALVAGGGLSAWSVWQEALAEGPRFWQEVAQHLRLVGGALLAALLIAAPLSVWVAGRARLSGPLLGFASGVQTVPSLALLGLLIAPLAALADAAPGLRALGVSGIGAAPALVAMTLYALLPLLRGGVLALQGVSPGALDAARGMGMSPAQSFWRVSLPLALPVWLSGLRGAAVLLVGVAAVAALVGAGGLGVYIFGGLQAGATDQILLGALPAAALALGLDAALRGLERGLGRGT